MLFDREYPSCVNFDSTISNDVVEMKSYMDSLFNPTCVPGGGFTHQPQSVKRGIVKCLFDDQTPQQPVNEDLWGNTI